MKLFVHGVPDTPLVWDPLIDALDLAEGDYLAPALPGFGCPRPAGFSATKDAYTDWLIGQMEAAGGNVDLVGHDWGGLLVLRAASVRPDLVRTWCAANAVIDPDYRGHTMARRWATPIKGELVMMGMRNKPRFLRGLIEAGMPPGLGEKEIGLIDKTMRQCILSLYRSADGLRFSGDWVADLDQLPERGQLCWGETDPFVPYTFAQRFSERRNVPLHIEMGEGHWACYTRAAEFAAVLKAHWA
jgi:pimeloyl-ACP methyl ester carboxylesterase